MEKGGFVAQVGRNGIELIGSQISGLQLCCDQKGNECLLYGVTAYIDGGIPISAEDVLSFFVEQGPEAVRKLTGEFVLVVFLNNHRRTVIAGDKLGSQPVFLLKDLERGRIIVSDKLSSLFSMSATIKVNLPAIIEYLQLGAITPPDTAFQGIYSIPPGSALVINDTTITEIHTYEPNIRKSYNVTNLLNTFLKAFQSSIELRVKDCNKVAVMLSGGVDSAAILFYAAQLIGTNKVEAFTIGPWGRESSEIPFARISAEYCSVKLNEEYGSRSILEDVPKLVDLLGQPNADVGAVATYRLSRLASNKSCEILLNGQNADTIFGAIPYVETMRKWNMLQKYLFARSIINRIGSLFNERTRLKIGFVCERDPIKAFLFKKTGYFLDHGGYDYIRLGNEFLKTYLLRKVKERFAQSYHYHVADLVILIDLFITESRRCIQAIKSPAILPVRMPYYDDRVVDAALQVPDSLRTVQGVDKYILRTAFKGKVHDTIVYKKPKSLIFPLHLWLDEAHILEQVSASPFINELIDVKKLVELKKMLKPNGWAHTLYKIWFLELWHSRFIESG
ncbi:MAG: asparagine synthase-related protein [Candidatus Bathyarchaeia archaeon]